MNALEIAMRMWPFWVFGLMMVMVAFASGNRDILRVQFKSVFSWIKILLFITAIRLIIFYFTWDEMAGKFSDVSWLPWQMMTMVWWEDAVHTLPLILLGRLIGTEKKTWPIHGVAIALTMIAFGSGHMYQGLTAAAMLSLYIPVTLTLGKEKGLGTIMICHILYDLATVLLIQGMLRYM